MTAVEWLVEQLQQNKFITESQIYLAKEMEKQQIIDAVDKTNSKWKSQKAEIILRGNQYYNETFKKK